MNFKIPSTNLSAITFRRENAHGNKNEKETFPKSTLLEKSPDKDKFELSVGYVNDTHGQTNNMMRILSGLKGDIRLSAGDNDIGDEKNQEIHKATIKFLNRADITATAVGNHEMDTTQADLMNSIKEYEGDMLAVNIKKDMIEDEEPELVKALGRAHLEKSLKPSKIVEVKGEKIGILGASPMDMLDRLTHPNYHKDVHIDTLDDSIEDIQEEVDKLKEQGVNKIFLLSHLGHKNDREVAKKTNGIDVIIGGHTHELIRDIKEGENLFYSTSGEPVIITEAGKDGNYFGKLNLEFSKEGVITKAQNNLGNTGLFKKNLINKYIFESVLGKPEKVGFVKSAPLPPKTLIEENPHANFVCDIMKEQTGADIALWHLCGVRNFFHEGEIDSRDVKDISPFLDYVVVAPVSEKTLVEVFKDAIHTTFNSHGHKPGLFATSGLEYTVNPKTGELVDMTFFDKDKKAHKIDVNNPSETKKYTVVTDEFLMSAGADYKILAPEEEYIKKYPYDKDVMVCEYLKNKNEPIEINQYGRFHFSE